MERNQTNSELNPLERMQSHPLRYVVMVMLLTWIAYSASGFRNPLTPILHADNYEGAAIRQVVFSLAALSSLILLFFTKSLGTALTLNRTMLLLSIIVPLSIIWSDDQALTLKRTFVFWFGLVTLYSTVYSAKQPVQLMLKMITLSAAAIAIISLTIHFAFGQAYTVNPVRPGLAGIASHPNNLAPIMSIALLLSLGIRAFNFQGKILLNVFQVLILVCLVLTNSITTMLSTIVGLMVYLILKVNHYLRGVIYLLLFSTASIIALVGVDTFKSAIFDATGRDESLSGRDEIWGVVSAEAMQRPFFGRGFGAFWTEGKGRELVQTWNPRQSHNSYLDLWLDLGAVGVIVMMLAFPVTLLSRWKSVRGEIGTPQRQAMAAIYAMVIGYMCTYAFAQSYFLRFDTFVFMSMCWSVIVIANPTQTSVDAEFRDSAFA